MPYVSSEERNRLNLHAWGSDVPQDVLDAALAATSVCVVKAEPEPTPKRARGRRGQFQADDPTTPDVNEAFAGG